MLDYAVLALAYLLLLAGAMGCFLPIVPGIPLIFAVFLGYGFYDRWVAYGWPVILAVLLVTVASVVIENVAGAVGAKAFGSGKAGMVGSVIGAIAGVIFFNIIGLIVGTFVGAVVFEMAFGRKELKEASSAGLGALLGCMGGSLFKFAIASVLIVLFTYLVATAGPG
ncbi:MAG: DUF456 domain-containing protein [Deltaproteobacteria bacterium]|jgi:uncharacterized protein YqgC (DUF456 family)|nr:DUF456 domain-containing protein [Deltaproteobacteria bacterium]